MLNINDIQVQYNLNQTQHDILHYLLQGKTEYIYTKNVMDFITNQLNLMGLNYTITEYVDNDITYYELKLT